VRRGGVAHFTATQADQEFTTLSVLNCDGNAEIFTNFYDVSFAKPYDVNSAPNSSASCATLFSDRSL
jgi:hypothetical protein